MRKCEFCQKEFEGTSIYCSDTCFLAAEAMNSVNDAESVEAAEVVEQELKKSVQPVHIKEIEVQKLSLQPGDTLIVTLKHDSISREDLISLRANFVHMFPDNKVALFNVGVTGDLVFSVASQSEVSYCSDCSCGKKAAAKKE
jgi:hypothetical protein